MLSIDIAKYCNFGIPKLFRVFPNTEISDACCVLVKVASKTMIMLESEKG